MSGSGSIVVVRKCRGESEHGKCELRAHHFGTDHAIHIGGEVWFVFPHGNSKGRPIIGYARWDDEEGWVEV